MTHTLHRKGNRESLAEDYVVLVMPAKGFDFEGSQEKMRQIWEVFSHYKENLVNFGNLKDGNSHTTDIEAFLKVRSRIAHAVFKDRETLKRCLGELKERDFGISVVVSGLHEDIEEICKDIGLSPHTVQHSLGLHGRTERLPGEGILEITTMCGHALVSSHLVGDLLKRVEKGEISPAEAAVKLSARCECGIFNPYRAEKLIKKLLVRNIQG